MKNNKNLSVDLKFTEIEEAEKYSNMIRFVFGNKTFSLSKLKKAINNAPLGDIEPLLRKFNLYQASFPYREEDLVQSIKTLKTLDEMYMFLTTTELDYHLSRIDELLELNDRVLKESSFFQDWEVKIEDLPLSPRIKNALKQKDIFTINDLSDYGFTEKNMLAIRNIGTLSLDELRRVIEPYSLILK